MSDNGIKNMQCDDENRQIPGQFKVTKFCFFTFFYKITT